MEAVKTWILGICASALISAAADILVPSGKIKNIVSFACGLLMIVSIISPIAKLDFSTLSKYIVDYKNKTDVYSEDIEDENTRLVKVIIEEEAEAYILDKAQDAGAFDISVNVNARLDEDCEWYLYSSEITGTLSEECRKDIGRLIEADLGIPEERQTWS